MIEIVLATANSDKAAEVRDILSAVLGPSVVLHERPTEVPEVEESGATLEDNARLKATALSEATGMLAVADDTGLEVDALSGRPGVYSSRFAGEGASYAANVAKLLSELTGSEDRRARFVTVALARFPDGDELVAKGVVEGEIAYEPRGGGGFGYDPIFVPDGGEGRSFAELSSAEKNLVSHRGRAFRSLARMLEDRL